MLVHILVHKFLYVENNLDKLWIIYVKKISTFESVENHTVFHTFCTQKYTMSYWQKFSYPSIFPWVVIFFCSFSTEFTVLLLLLYIMYIF